MKCLFSPSSIFFLSKPLFLFADVKRNFFIGKKEKKAWKEDGLLPGSRHKSTSRTSWRTFARRTESILRRSRKRICIWPVASIRPSLCNSASPSLPASPRNYRRRCSMENKSIIRSINPETHSFEENLFVFQKEFPEKRISQNRIFFYTRSILKLNICTDRFRVYKKKKIRKSYISFDRKLFKYYICRTIVGNKRYE